MLALPLAERIAKYIARFSDNKRGISYFSDITTIDGKEFYEIALGYNTPIRFEIYNTLYVNRTNADDICIMEPVSGDIIPIADYKDNRNYNASPEKQPTDCFEMLWKIVKSSDIVKNPLFKGSENEYFLDVDRVEGANIYVQVYRRNNTSDDPQYVQIVDATIASLLFDVAHQKLFDITLDTENPKELKYDKKLLEDYDMNICIE